MLFGVERERETTANLPMLSKSKPDNSDRVWHSRRLIPVLENFPANLRLCTVAMNTIHVYILHKLALAVAIIYWLSMINCQNIFIVCDHFPLYSYACIQRFTQQHTCGPNSIRASIFLCKQDESRIKIYRHKYRANHDKQIYWDIWMEMRLCYRIFGGRIIQSFFLIHFVLYVATNIRTHNCITHFWKFILHQKVFNFVFEVNWADRYMVWYSFMRSIVWQNLFFVTMCLSFSFVHLYSEKKIEYMENCGVWGKKLTLTKSEVKAHDGIYNTHTL